MAENRKIVKIPNMADNSSLITKHTQLDKVNRTVLDLNNQETFRVVKTKNDSGKILVKEILKVVYHGVVFLQILKME